MSRSQEEWDEQKNIALNLRNLLWTAMDETERIDDSRFDECSDAMYKMKEYLNEAVTQMHLIIGTLTRGFE
jgi:hypothetical protein